MLDYVPCDDDDEGMAFDWFAAFCFVGGEMIEIKKVFRNIREHRKICDFHLFSMWGDVKREQRRRASTLLSATHRNIIYSKKNRENENNENKKKKFLVLVGDFIKDARYVSWLRVGVAVAWLFLLFLLFFLSFLIACNVTMSTPRNHQNISLNLALETTTFLRILFFCDFLCKNENFVKKVN